jgi:ubiquinone/menaquinone biosynthesis C-methylase UbiE
MQKTNDSMIRTTIQRLDLQDGDNVLEIGPGNGYHLAAILNAGEAIKYEGLDISETMIEAANELNETLKKDYSVNFTKYDGQHIPFEQDSFHKIMTVNTLYFWQSPSAFLKELERVLKPNGLLIVTFGEKEFMEKLPFVKDKFTTYNAADFRTLVSATSLRIQDIIRKTEEVESKNGEKVKRVFLVAEVVKL